MNVTSSGLQDTFTLHAHETATVEFEGGLDQPKILEGSTTHYRIYRYDNQGKALSGTGTRKGLSLVVVTVNSIVRSTAFQNLGLVQSTFEFYCGSLVSMQGESILQA